MKKNGLTWEGIAPEIEYVLLYYQHRVRILREKDVLLQQG